ncbi:hypothetical protein B0F90DRAFT_1733608 [Multifurca ochricompacta]|uniref:Uncharacterized protein n=1 Tax=Multifurca ochricompacta TaxID=376703 RepID=A0AAD4QMA0_9AGAM|nr:hypothetical protein B0F90DRAFT_1733608 [Multifurca ochricompacta]
MSSVRLNTFVISEDYPLIPLRSRTNSSQHWLLRRWLFKLSWKRMGRGILRRW